MVRLDGAEELVQRFVSLFLTSVAGHLTELNVALARGDVSEVYFRSHTVGGTAANLGAPQIRYIATQMEALSKSGSLAGVPDLYADLEN